MKGDAGDIIGMAFKGEDWLRIGSFDLEKLDGVVSSCGKILFIW
jgi:hypothetical protein